MVSGARRRLTPEEEKAEEADAVGDVECAVLVAVARDAPGASDGDFEAALSFVPRGVAGGGDVRWIKPTPTPRGRSLPDAGFSPATRVRYHLCADSE